MLQRTMNDEVRSCASAISELLDGRDLHTGLNALLLVSVSFVLANADPIDALEDAVDTLRRNVLSNLTPRPGDSKH